jgi:hypothetical protein
MSWRKLGACSFALSLFATMNLNGQTPDADTATDAGGTYSKSAYLAGKAAATEDLRNGKLAVETFGLPPRHDVYAEILKADYQVELRSIAGCLIDDKILGHAKGYNEISEAEIKRRFGADVFTKARAASEKH